MTLQELYSLAKPVSEELEQFNKYTYAGYHGIIEARVLEINDILGKGTGLDSYLATNYKVMLLPNKANGIIVDMFVKPLEDEGRPLKLGSKTFPFGMQYLNKDFKYGDVIILVEGAGDLAGLRFINPSLNVIAMQTSVIGQEHMELLSAITDKVLLLTDNDKTGDDSRGKITYRFKKLGVTCIPLNQYATLKDTGQILELALKYVERPLEVIKNALIDITAYYNTIINLQRF